MKKQVLVVNQNVEELYEFKQCFEGTEYEVTVAENGYDALILLKQNIFAVVVTSLALKGYNGEQIVSYVGRKSPLTRCIVYAPMISPAQLKYLYNEHQIFRLYVKPVELESVIKKGIEEAVLEYDTAVVVQAEEAEHQEWMLKEKMANQEVRDRIKFKKEGFRGMEQFVVVLLKTGASYLDGKTDSEKQQLILMFQKKIFQKLYVVNKLSLNDITDVTTYLERDKIQMGYAQNVRIIQEKNIRANVEQRILKRAYLISWILLLIYRHKGSSYVMTFKYETPQEKGIQISLQIDHIEEQLFRKEQKELQFLGNCILQTVSKSCVKLEMQKENSVTYQILLE